MDFSVMRLQEPRGEHVLRRKQSAALNCSKRSSKRGTSTQNEESTGESNKNSQEIGRGRGLGVMALKMNGR